MIGHHMRRARHLCADVRTAALFALHLSYGVVAIPTAFVRWARERINQ